MSVLLDSNAYSLLMRGDAQVGQLVQAADRVFFSAVVIGELMYGFRRGSRLQQNSEILRSYLGSPRVSVVSVGESTANYYSMIAAALRSKGRPIPTNDMWVAAHVMETGAELISSDNHFEQVEGIAWTRIRPLEA